jgi:hypothetical protein
LFERDAVSPAQRLEQAAGQAGHAAGEFEFEQLRLQLGGAEAGACAQCIQPHGVVAHAAQQPVFRHGIDVFGSRVRSGENGGVFQTQLFEHVAHRLDQLRSLADQGWQPRDWGEWIEPGMANTSLPCSVASLAVISEPTAARPPPPAAREAGDDAVALSGSSG